MNIVDQLRKRRAGRPASIAPRWPILLPGLFALGFAAGGCADPYAYGPPAPYAGGGYYGAPPPYAAGPGYAYPGYGYGGGSVVVDINDRAYYTRGPGYYVGHSYYVWKPGHWVVRNGRRYWIHGHYVLRS